jgi:spermidine synthase
MLENSPRFNLYIEDGVKYVKQTDTKYDVVIVDSTDPIGPATPLFNVDFYNDLNNLLSDNGIVVSQGESPFYQSEAQTSLLKILKQTFPIVGLYNFSNLTYPGGLWSFTFASKKLHPTKDFQAERVTSSGLEFKYYNEDIHCASFILPNFIKNKVKDLINL